MNQTDEMKQTMRHDRFGWWLFLAALALTTAVYWAGLSGSYLFDDYPNIVDNTDVQPTHANLPSLLNAAMSSPSSEFKRPLASLSFAANFLATGLIPYWMKLTNLAIHLLNGLLVFLLARLLLLSAPRMTSAEKLSLAVAGVACGTNEGSIGTASAVAFMSTRTDVIATLIAAAWMLLPINLTAVLYVVQRMESLANLFVLLGLIGYVAGRRHMLATNLAFTARPYSTYDWGGFWLCVASITLPTAIGLFAKETAVMLPLYALLIEWLLLGFRIAAPSQAKSTSTDASNMVNARDKRLLGLFLVVLVLPMIVGLTWLLPDLLQPDRWSTRNFTLGTRLLSEARIVVDYIIWTLLPTPQALSFYHDDFKISTGLMAPWATLACIFVLAGLVTLICWLRSRNPLAALGIALFLGCQLLTATILPLELIYEHRNYFASFGLLLAIVPLLAAIPGLPPASLSFALPRRVLLVGLLFLWAAETAMTASAWGNPLHLAQELAGRAPESPRAQYELGRTYIIYSHYDPRSPFTKLAYAPLEKAAGLPDSSILPEQALIFMNARMHLPLKDSWWDSLIAKLNTNKPTVQDESSLAALTKCAREHECNLPQGRMTDAFIGALSHPRPDARLLANYADYAWNVLDDKSLGQRMAELAVLKSPDEPAYRITLIRMLLVEGQLRKAHEALAQLQSLNFGGRLNGQLAELRALPGM
jgi:protein O-mannosyl-transferase